MSTSQQDAFIFMAHYRSGVYKDGTWTYSLQLCLNQFREAFPDTNISYKTFARRKYRIIKRFEERNCICKGKSPGRPTILTDEYIGDIQEQLEKYPTKSIRQISTHLGITHESCRKAIKRIKNENLN